MLHLAESAQRAGEIVSRYYERPGLTEEIRAREAASRGAAAAQIHQTTNITVTGTETPRETARAVAGAQNDVNANLVRNSLPVVRQELLQFITSENTDDLPWYGHHALPWQPVRVNTSDKGKGGMSQVVTSEMRENPVCNRAM